MKGMAKNLLITTAGLLAITGIWIHWAVGESSEKPATHAAEPAAPAAQEPVKETAPVSTVLKDKDKQACLTDPAAIEDLRKKKEEIEARAKVLDAKEEELKTKGIALEEEIKSLQNLRDEIAKINELQKADRQEKVAKIVETIEAMSPKASAKLLSSIDDALAVAAMSALNTQKLAKIVNLMEPDDSSRLTELMAGVARAKKQASRDASEAAKKRKGGEKINDTNNQTKSESDHQPADPKQLSQSGQKQPSQPESKPGQSSQSGQPGQSLQSGQQQAAASGQLSGQPSSAESSAE
ncbi:hypothetical protein K2X30_04115 [bacterium]|nr:hypothetical protein [bacterium]